MRARYNWGLIAALALCLCFWLVLGWTLVSCASAAQFSGDAAAVASTMRTHVPGPAGAVDVQRAPCPGVPSAAGCFDGQTVYWSDDDPWTLEHELGHAFDASVLTDAARARLERALGYPRLRAWRPGVMIDVDGSQVYSCLIRSCPVEVFADAYASCALGLTPPPWGRNRWPREWRSTYGWWPTRRQQRDACRIIRQAA